MSLAELLKADLEDLDDEQEELDQLIKNEMNEDIEDVGMIVEDTKPSIQTDFFNKESVRSIAKLLDSHQLKHIIEQIEEYQKKNSANRMEIAGPVEHDPE